MTTKTPDHVCLHCSMGDCHGHVEEYLDAHCKVRVCKCQDPDQKHGKRRPNRQTRHIWEQGRCLNCGTEYVYRPEYEKECPGMRGDR